MSRKLKNQRTQKGVVIDDFPAKKILDGGSVIRPVSKIGRSFGTNLIYI